MDPAEYTRICNYKVKAQYPEGFSKCEKNNFSKKANTYDIDGKSMTIIFVNCLYVIILMIVYLFVFYCVNPCCLFTFSYYIYRICFFAAGELYYIRNRGTSRASKKKVVNGADKANAIFIEFHYNRGSLS